MREDGVKAHKSLFSRFASLLILFPLVLACDTAIKGTHWLVSATGLHLKEKGLVPPALWTNRLGLVCQRPRILPTENVIDDLAGKT